MALSREWTRAWPRWPGDQRKAYADDILKSDWAQQQVLSTCHVLPAGWEGLCDILLIRREEAEAVRDEEIYLVAQKQEQTDPWSSHSHTSYGFEWYISFLPSLRRVHSVGR